MPTGRLTAMMTIPRQYEHLAGPLARFATRLAATASMTDEQLRLPLRRPPTAPRPMPRQSRPAPPASRQFLRAMSTQVLRDQRLTPSARALAVLIVAIAGKAGHVDVTRGYFADRLGVSERTVARLLAQLRAHGYIATARTIGMFGETTGLRVELLGALLPYWETDQPPVVGEGVTALTWQQELTSNQDLGGLPARYPVLAYPRYRRSRRDGAITGG